jgi:DNA-binding NtrC family response regulator
VVRALLGPSVMILILSADPVGAALLGALIETLGYNVTFARPPETPDASFRRIRPKVGLIDCADPSLCNGEVFGRAAMRGIAVVVFGIPEELERVRALVSEHGIDTLLVPPDEDALADTLRRALAKTG